MKLSSPDQTWAHHFCGSIITLSNPPENLGMGQTPPSQVPQLTVSGNLTRPHPLLSGNARISEAPVIARVTQNLRHMLMCVRVRSHYFGQKTLRTDEGVSRSRMVIG